MSFQVGWDKRQLSRDGPPLEGLPLVGRRSHSLAGPSLLSADPQVFSAHRFKAARSRLRLNQQTGETPEYEKHYFQAYNDRWLPFRGLPTPAKDISALRA